MRHGRALQWEKKFPGKNGNIRLPFFSLGPSAKTEIWPRQRPDFRVKTEVKKKAPFYYYIFSAILLKRSDGNMHVLLQVQGGMLHWHSRIFTY